MAKIVLGLASAHSPMLSLQPDMWPLFAERDKGNKMLTAVPSGEVVSYETLLEQTSPSVVTKANQENFDAQHAACQKAITTLEETLAEANPDVVVIIGDDQEELFFDDNMPLFAIYWGDKMRLIPRGQDAPANSILGASGWGYGDVEMDVPVNSQLALYLIEKLLEADFDMAQCRYLKDEYSGSVGPSGYIGSSIVTEKHRQGMPHAYAYVVKRIMNGKVIPIVPVIQNTFYPPNQPTPKRCYDLGRAIAKAIESWDSDKRVAIVASGGLSHFTVDEEIDWMALNGMKNKDAEALSSLPRNRLNSGHSEILNWVTAAGALEHLDFEVVDYVPVYRSPAGTGGGWGFGRWQ
ncbi:MAG TPA: extradiol ring-cleavage dioxygenase [Dehalococcoidia bacterium]|nr:extradiol ring-cleavage dioxygenase [Dehalococcoidia bacterium]